MDVRILDDEPRDIGSELTLPVRLRSAIPFSGNNEGAMSILRIRPTTNLLVPPKSRGRACPKTTHCT